MIEITDQMVESMYHSFNYEVSRSDILIALQNALTPDIPLLSDDYHDYVIYDFETVYGDMYDIGILSTDLNEVWVVDRLGGPRSRTVPVSKVTAYTDQKMTKRFFKSPDNNKWESVEL